MVHSEAFASIFNRNKFFFGSVVLLIRLSLPSSSSERLCECYAPLIDRPHSLQDNDHKLCRVTSISVSNTFVPSADLAVDYSVL